MAHCPEHPKYMGNRAPRNSCHSCWRLYTEKNDVSVEEMADRTRTSETRASWLRENIDDIIYAPLEESVVHAPPQMPERARASFMTEAEVVEQPEEDKESKPARGMKV